MRKTDYSKAVLLKDGTLENFTLTVQGQSFHCPIEDCGCNVFHKPDRTNLNVYRCNGCRTTFEAQ